MVRIEDLAEQQDDEPTDQEATTAEQRRQFRQVEEQVAEEQEAQEQDQQPAPSPEGTTATVDGTDTQPTTPDQPPSPEPEPEPEPEPQPQREPTQRERVPPEEPTQPKPAPSPEPGTGLQRAELNDAQIQQIEEQFEQRTGRDLEFREDFVIERQDGRLRAQLTEPAQRELAADEFERQIEEQTGRDVTPGEEFTVTREGNRFTADLSGAFVASLSREAAREAGRDLQQPTTSRAAAGFDIDVEAVEDAFEREAGEAIPGRTAIDFSEVQRAIGEAQGMVDDGVSERAGTPRAVTGGRPEPEKRIVLQLEEQIEEKTGETVNLTTEDVVVTREDGQLSGELSISGRRKVAIETAELVGPTEGTPAEDIFRTGARLDFEFDVFRERTFGTEADVAEGIISGTRDVGRGILSGAVAAAPVAVAEPTPFGELGVGGAAIGGAALVGAAAAAESVQEGAPQFRTAATRFFPPEQEVPKDRELFPSELTIEEQNVFVPELQPPAVPASQISAGRFTPPEVPVEDVGTLGGPEVEVSEDVEPLGPVELPVPTLTASPVGRTRQRQVGEGEERMGTERFRRETPSEPTDVPTEFIPERFREGTGGALGGAGVVFRRGRTRPAETIIETPTADIDIATIQPQLARVLEAQPGELGDTGFGTLERLELAGEPGVTPEPFAPVARQRQRPRARSETILTPLFDTDVTGTLDVGQATRPAVEPRIDTRLDERAAQRTGIGQRADEATTPAVTPDVTQDLSQRTVPDTVTETTTATPTEPTVPEVPGFGFEFRQPDVTVPGTGVPALTTPRTGVPRRMFDLPTFDAPPARREFEAFAEVQSVAPTRSVADVLGFPALDDDRDDEELGFVGGVTFGGDIELFAVDDGPTPEFEPIV